MAGWRLSGGGRRSRWVRSSSTRLWMRSARSCWPCFAAWAVALPMLAAALYRTRTRWGLVRKLRCAWLPARWSDEALSGLFSAIPTPLVRLCNLSGLQKVRVPSSGGLRLSRAGLQSRGRHRVPRQSSHSTASVEAPHRCRWSARAAVEKHEVHLRGGDFYSPRCLQETRSFQENQHQALCWPLRLPS